MPIYVPATGPSLTPLVCLGEAPGQQEEENLKNFCGSSGQFLRSMLSQVGIDPNSVLYLNVCRFKPPNNDIKHFIKDLPNKLKPEHLINSFQHPVLAGDFEVYKGRLVLPFVKDHIQELEQEIVLAQPKVVLALGATALWALTGLQGITHWMGSVIPVSVVGSRNSAGILVIPTPHPAAILRQYSWRFHTLAYFRKAKNYLPTVEKGVLTVNLYKKKRYKINPRPTFQEASTFIIKLQGKIFVDIETQPKTLWRDHIECLGICNESDEAMCFPFVENGKAYWGKEEEKILILLLREKLRTLEVIGQNFCYDAQFIANWWMVIPNIVWDTMTSFHTIFPACEKALDYQSALLLDDHMQWKQESQEDRFLYNCKDCIVTKRIYEIQLQLAKAAGLEDQVAEQNALYCPALKMMLRGLRRDLTAVEEVKQELDSTLSTLETSANAIVGYEINLSSPIQLKDLFYTQLKQRGIIHRKTKALSADKDAMKKIAAREPALAPLTAKVNAYRSFKVYRKTFIAALPDADGRMRFSLKQSGTITFRWASSKAVSGNGLNIQNIPSGEEEEDLGPLDQRPNIRKLFVPDPGYTIVDVDLKGADFQVLVWEAGDRVFKQMLQEGVDIHAENAKLLGISRQLAKIFIHAADYLASARTLAEQCGMTTHAADLHLRNYFAEHPAIKNFHRRVQVSLKETSGVSNIFGYKVTYMDRIASVVTDATNWIPQSTVAIVTGKGILNIEANLPEVQLLFQVHDNIVCQVLTKDKDRLVPLIKQNALIPLPYADPLTIPVDVKTSEKSWGDVR